MSERVWTAEEFEKLAPHEQDEVFAASIERDLDLVPDAFLDRVRSRLQRRLDAETRR